MIQCGVGFTIRKKEDFYPQSQKTQKYNNFYTETYKA